MLDGVGGWEWNWVMGEAPFWAEGGKHGGRRLGIRGIGLKTWGVRLLGIRGQAGKPDGFRRTWSWAGPPRCKLKEPPVLFA